MAHVSGRSNSDGDVPVGEPGTVDTMKSGDDSSEPAETKTIGPVSWFLANLAAFAAGLVVCGGLSFVIGMFAADRPGGPGFSSSELKVLPWLLFFIVYPAVKAGVLETLTGVPAGGHQSEDSEECSGPGNPVPQETVSCPKCGGPTKPSVLQNRGCCFACSKAVKSQS